MTLSEWPRALRRPVLGFQPGKDFCAFPDSYHTVSYLRGEVPFAAVDVHASGLAVAVVELAAGVHPGRACPPRRLSRP